ncbi:MAG: HAD family hydrolase [Deltaproteobacteria bacterium]|nr:HAD family hydrolase [Deltaproteobacteria bacterium]
MKEITTSNDKLILDAVIFDLDGTLIDTIEIYFRIIDTVLDRLKLPPVAKRDLAEAVKDGDFDWDCVLPDDLKDRKYEVIKKAWKIIEEIDQEISNDDLKMIPGADVVLGEISACGMKIGLVTSTPKFKINDKLYPFKKAGIDDLFEVVITTDDAPRKKPAADPLIECGKRLDVAVDKSVYVGDSRVDVKAGKAAGMTTIGVLTGLDDYDSLKKEDPDLIIDSVIQLREVIDFNS